MRRQSIALGNEPNRHKKPARVRPECRASVSIGRLRSLRMTTCSGWAEAAVPGAGVPRGLGVSAVHGPLTGRGGTMSASTENVASPGSTVSS